MNAVPTPENDHEVPAPNRTFIFSLVCFTGVAAIGVFLLASATAQGSPNAFTRDSVSLLGLIVTAIWASQSWSSIARVEPESNPAFREKHRTFASKGGAIITGVLFSAAAVGAYFGIRAGHIAKLNALSNESYELGLKTAPMKKRFIELATENTQDLAEYLRRCTELEAAINDYEPALRQMDDLMSQTQQEIEDLKFDASYASVLPSFGVMRAVIGEDLESAKAYRIEIGYAKQLPVIPESDRNRFYNANIQPVVEQEGKIVKDEIQILTDAKARGVKMPESMYQGAGIDKERGICRARGPDDFASYPNSKPFAIRRPDTCHLGRGG